MITISRGPQFNGWFRRIILLVCVYLFWQTIHTFTNEAYAYSVLSLTTLSMLFPVFLDYRGVQIDLKNKRIRKYQAYLILKWGRWQSLTPYKSVELQWERVKYKSGSSAVAFLGPMIANTNRTSDAYCVYLVGSGVSRIELADLGSHKSARKFMIKYAKILDLPVEDRYEKRLASAAKRRKKIESRRKRR